MSIVKNNKIAARNARIAKNEKISEAKALYKHERIEIAEAEHSAMNEMLNIARHGNRLLTAKEIASQCHSDISKHEVAGNLIAMSNKCSRYQYSKWYGNHKISEVKIPYPSDGEAIKIFDNLYRTATFAELDENGNIIEGTQFTKRINLPNLYRITKIDK